MKPESKCNINTISLLAMDVQAYIIRSAILSRVFVLLIQYIGNTLISDHDAGVFLYPKLTLQDSYSDKVVKNFLGGFVRWDAQYFLHIIKYGYTYENTLAFFPLYPIIVKIFSIFCSPVLIFLNEESVILLTILFLNTLFFVLAALNLYKLSYLILDRNLAYKATILFCFNPASVFFSAPYTESLYSYLTFKSMVNVVLLHDKWLKSGRYLNCRDIVYIIPICLSTCTRSNGLLNVGFLVYYLFDVFVKRLQDCTYSASKKVMIGIKFLLIVITSSIFCILPFIVYQVYSYSLFCTDFVNNLPKHITEYGLTKNYILPGMVSKYNQSWCFKDIPFAYSYVQEHYWNVGFMQYYEIKQIPNFILASPMIFIMIRYSYEFFQQHLSNILYIFICKKKVYRGELFELDMFVFVVHALFLTVFNIFCIHVQVTTRIICSASPVFYWYSSYIFSNVEYRNNFNLFIFNKNLNIKQKLIKYYCLLYTVVGTIMFCNFLPWT